MLHNNVKGRSEYQANNLANYRLKIKANHYGSITMTASTWVDAFNQRATTEQMKARNIQSITSHWHCSSSKSILILSLPVIFFILGHLINTPFTKRLQCPCHYMGEPLCPQSLCSEVLYFPHLS